MSRLLPYRPAVETTDDEPTVIGLRDDTATAFDVLSCSMARSILSRLYEAPATKSALSSDVDTSLQNVDYHVTNLVSADLVEVVGEWYSEKGVEMKVYAPTGKPLVLVAGDTSAIAAVREAADEAVDPTEERAVSDDVSSPPPRSAG